MKIFSFFKRIQIGKISCLFFIVLVASCAKENAIPESDTNLHFFSLSTGEKVFKSISLKNGNFAMVGEVQGDAFISINTAKGEVIAYSKFGGNLKDAFYDIIETQNGNLIAVGAIKSASLGAQSEVTSDGYLVVFNSNTEVITKKIIGSEYDLEEINCVLENPAGGYILGGMRYTGAMKSYVVSLDANYDIKWEHYYNVGPYHNFTKAICFSPSGDIVIGGLCSNQNNAVNSRKFDTYLVVLGQLDGKVIKGRVYTDYTRADQFSNSFIAGSPLFLFAEQTGYRWFTFIEGSNYTGQCQIINLDLDFNIIKEKRIHGLNVHLPHQVIKTEDEGYLICGQSSAESLGPFGFSNASSSLIKLDKSGIEEWQSNCGSDQSISACLGAVYKEEQWQVLSSIYNPNNALLNFAMYTVDNKGKIVNTK
jgi:hypothetical protein